jgi:hypothetical protein
VIAGIVDSENSEINRVICQSAACRTMPTPDLASDLNASQANSLSEPNTDFISPEQGIISPGSANASRGNREPGNPDDSTRSLLKSAGG